MSDKDLIVSMYDSVASRLADNEDYQHSQLVSGELKEEPLASKEGFDKDSKDSGGSR